MSRGGSIVGAAMSLIAASLCGCVARSPMTVSESFANPHPRAVNPPGTARRNERAAGCPLIVDAITDTRSDPAILGTVAGRAVHAPANSGTWLQNVVAGFDSRDIDVSFDANTAHEATPLIASLTLRIAWVSDIHTSKTANALWHMRLRRGETQLVDADFRGADTALNWSSGDGELQRMVDRALGKALDLMADEVHAACGH